MDYNYDGTADEFFRHRITGDIPVVGNWNVDLKSKVGVFRDCVFDLRDSTGGTEWFGYGLTDDSPIACDWDGDGFIEVVGVFRDGSFYLRASDGSTYATIEWGLSGDSPIASKWV
jgi:hypothetical protein